MSGFHYISQDAWASSWGEQRVLQALPCRGNSPGQFCPQPCGRPGPPAAPACSRQPAPVFLQGSSCKEGLYVNGPLLCPSAATFVWNLHQLLGSFSALTLQLLAFLSDKPIPERVDSGRSCSSSGSDHVLEERLGSAPFSLFMKYLLSLAPESTGYHHENCTQSPEQR